MSNQKKPYFSRKYNCPLCATAFGSYSIRSSSVFVERRDSDLHVLYREPSPLYYSIIVCPSCQYAASSTSFNEALPPQQKEQLTLAFKALGSTQRPSFSEERDALLAVQCFQLAVRTAQLKRVPPGELAGLLLGTAWVAQEADQPEIETVYRSEALKCYLQAYEDSSSIGNLSELQVAYLIGELYRREKNYQQAVIWFNRVISSKRIKENPAIEKMAREQWALSREEAQQEKG